MELRSTPEYEKLIWGVVHCRGVLHTSHGNSFVRTLATAGTVAGRESYYYMRYDDSPERDNVPMMFYAVIGDPKVDVILHEEVEPIGELFNTITVMDSSILLHKTSQRALIFDGAKRDAVLVVNTSLPPERIVEAVKEAQLTHEWTGKLVTIRARSYDTEIAYPLLGALLKAWGTIKLEDLSTALELLGKADKIGIVERAYGDVEPTGVNIKADKLAEKKKEIPKLKGYWDLETYRKYQIAASKAPSYADRISAMPRWEAIAPGQIEFGPKPGEKNIGFTTAFDRYMRPIIDVEKCTNCKLCHHYCPDGAISFDIKFDFDYCTGCGICEKVCPMKAISRVTEWERVKGLKEEEIVTVEQALREYGY
jgi:pyruvate ferredoxin oxidoreductase delta subunit